MSRQSTFYIIFCFLFLWNCASIKPPPGGEVDEIPPTIIAVNPPNSTINLETRKVVIKFSEYMDENSFKNGINIFPKLNSPLELKFRGDEIILSLPDSMDSEDTYIISFNRNIKDEHGIALANTTQLAYSSGSKISTGIISGQVYSADQASVHLWKINDSALDSIFATVPAYITDVSEDGKYSFGYLSSGKYQILAIDKSTVGLPLNTKRSKYGLYWGNTVTLSDDDTLRNINLRLWKEPQDLKLLSGEWSAFNCGKLVFNNELNKEFIFNMTITTEDSMEVDLTHHYIDPIDNKNLIMQLQDISEQKSLEINIESIMLKDEAVLDSSVLNIQIPQKPDTSYLQILEPKSNYQLIPDIVMGTSLDIILSRPCSLNTDSTSLLELYQNDSIQVKISVEQINPMHIKIVPTQQWEENARYKLLIPMGGIVAESGRGLKDSLKTVTISTTKGIGYGSVSGQITNSEIGNLVTELISVKNPSLSRSALVNSKSQFEFKSIAEGDYSLYFYKDNDENMKYNFGKAYPLESSEWFFYYPDTFEVRANWDTEIIPITLPEID